MLLALARRAGRTRAQRLALGAIALGLLCLADTPLLLVLSRPEQPLILCAGAATLLALGAAEAEAPRAARAWPRAVAVLALAAIALSYHLKGVFLGPLFGVCLLLASWGRAAMPARVAGGVALVAITALAAAYWVHRMQCPGDPVLRAMYAHVSAGAPVADLQGWRGLVPLVRRIVLNTNPFAYFVLAAPSRHPLSQWLPPGQLTAAAALQAKHALVAVWAVVLAVALAHVPLALWRSWRARRLDPRLALAAALVLGVAAWSATQLVRNFYEAGFVLPLLALAALLLLAAPIGRSLALLQALTAGFVALVACVSLALTIALWRPSLTRAWGEDGYVPEQGHSIAVRGFAAVERDIAATARLCGLPPPARARALMLDDVTYFPYMRSKLPQHELGVIGVWRGTIADPIAYLKSRGSDGVLVTCGLLPPDLLARARRQGEFCCLAPPRW